jgi:hypoxanthine phosphoribosyltransferase
MRERIEFETPTWNQIHNLLIKQSKKILSDNFVPDIIIAITRGGWVPARLLSDLLEVQNVSTIRIEFYLDIAKTRKKPVLTQKLQIPVSGKKILLVDDVADTGESLQLAKNHILQQNDVELKIATIYKKIQSKIEPDYYEKTTKNWIIFPWEIKETSRKLLNKNEKKSQTNFKEVDSKTDNITKKMFKKFLKEITEGTY